MSPIMQVLGEFVRFFNQPKPILKVKFDEGDVTEDSIDVLIRNGVRLSGKPKDLSGIKWLDQLDDAYELKAFYTWINEARLFIPRRPWSCESTPLVHFLKPERIEKITELYQPGGKLAHIIDLHKSRKIYRSNDKWIVFALICGSRPTCLTTFLDGEHAGSIFYLTMDPSLDFLKPIAKSFNSLLAKIQKDPVKFLQLVDAQVPVSRKDGFSYTYRPIEYIPSKELIPELA